MRLQGPTSSRRRAFTLVELLVVLGIIAVTTAVVTPNVGRGLRGMRVRQAALTLAAHIRYGQMLSVEKERPARVVLDSEGRGYRVELALNLLGVEFGPGPGVGREGVGLPEGVDIGRMDFSLTLDGRKNVLLFDPSGEWSAGTMELTDGERTFRVVVGGALGEVDTVEVAGEGAVTGGE